MGNFTKENFFANYRKPDSSNKPMLDMFQHWLRIRKR